jgi:hypothetical protein
MREKALSRGFMSLLRAATSQHTMLLGTVPEDAIKSIEQQRRQSQVTE